MAGFLVTAPAGPLTLLAAKALFQRNFLFAFGLCLGTIVADTLAAAIVLSGLKAPALSAVSSSPLLLLASGLLVLGIGSALLLKDLKAAKTTSSPAQNNEPAQKKTIQPALSFLNLKQKGLLFGFLLSFGLIFFNPMTFGGIVALFNTLHIGAAQTPTSFLTWPLLAFLLGCASWWGLLLGIFHSAGKKLSDTILGHINRFIAVVLCFFGALATLTAIGKLT